MLTLILADAELETIPGRMVGHPAVAATARGKDRATRRTLLDASKHHHAMRETDLPDHERRGRPDIVHQVLLTALDSTLTLEGGLQVLVHTRHDILVTVDPETRIMRDRTRFDGLIESLLEKGQVGPRGRDPLLTAEEGVSVTDALADLDPDHVLALGTEGQATEPYEALPALAEAHDHVAVIIGGFPKGDYTSPVDELADEVWKVHDERLSAWVAAAEMLVPWRYHTRGLDQHRA